MHIVSTSKQEVFYHFHLLAAGWASRTVCLPYAFEILVDGRMSKSELDYAAGISSTEFRIAWRFQELLGRGRFLQVDISPSPVRFPPGLHPFQH